MPQHLSSLACAALLCALAGCAATPAPHGYRGTPVTVYAAGDIADCRYRLPGSSGAAATAWLVEAGLAAHPDARVLTLGDHTYPVGAPAEFSDCYAPTWGRFRDRTLPTPGNHEYYSPGAPGYFTYFGARAAPEQGAYYSVHFIRPCAHWRSGTIHATVPAAMGTMISWRRCGRRWRKAASNLLSPGMTITTSVMRRRMRMACATTHAACGSSWSAPAAPG
jgi:hypothetical protein